MGDTSKAEKAFIIDGCNLGVRYDGRDINTLRAISLENAILPHVNGSSRLKIDDSTDLLCSIKLEIVEPKLSEIERGSLVVSVDISPSCRVFADDRALQAEGASVAEQLQRILLSSAALDMKQFCILKGKFCWAVHIDIMILQLDGNPLDACCMAAYIALGCTVIPATEPIPGETGLLEDFDVVGDIAQGAPVQMGAFPLVVTLAKVGDVFLVDSSAEEQACASCMVAVAVDKQGSCCGQSFLKPGMLTLAEIQYCQEKATAVAAGIFSHFDKFTAAAAAAGRVSGSASVEKQHAEMPLNRVGLLL